MKNDKHKRSDLDARMFITDADFNRVASDLIDCALLAAGETIGTRLLDVMQSGLREAPGFITSELSERQGFVHSAAQEYLASASQQTRDKMRVFIIGKLRQAKAAVPWDFTQSS